MKRRERWMMSIGPGGLAPQERRHFEAMNGGNTSFECREFRLCGDEDLVVEYLQIGRERQPPPRGLTYPFAIPADGTLEWRLPPLPGALNLYIGIKNEGKTARTFCATFIGPIESLD